MVTCPKCNKNLDQCSSWPAWGVELCILVHRALDCEGMDDTFDDLEGISSIPPNNVGQYVALKIKLERELRFKTTNPNAKCIKKLSEQLARRVATEPHNWEIKNTIRSKLGIFV